MKCEDVSQTHIYPTQLSLGHKVIFTKPRSLCKLGHGVMKILHDRTSGIKVHCSPGMARSGKQVGIVNRKHEKGLVQELLPSCGKQERLICLCDCCAAIT